MPVRGAEPRKRPTPTTKPEIEVTDGVASVSYLVSYTKNLGDYNSIKVQAGITIPHGASDELLADLDSLMVTAREAVTTRLNADMDEITNAL